MGVQTLIVKGGHNADYFQNEAFPDKTATTGHFVAVFESSGTPHANWDSRMPLSYNPVMDVDIVIDWFSVSVTSGAVVWDIEIERLAANGNPLNADNFDLPQSVTSTVSATLAALQRATVTLTNAEFDGVQNGDSFRLRMTRDTSSGSDTLIGDALMLNWSLKSNV